MDINIESRFTQMLRVRCSPTEFTEFTEFVSVGTAGMPYPPTSVLIRVICGSLFSARSFREFRAFCGNLFPPTEFTEFGSVGMAGMPYPPTSVRIRAHLWEALLCKRFCVFGAFRGSFFTVCSVGAAETAAPPGGIHRSSVQISPFHLEPSLLHVLPVLWV